MGHREGEGRKGDQVDEYLAKVKYLLCYLCIAVIVVNVIFTVIVIIGIAIIFIFIDTTIVIVIVIIIDTVTVPFLVLPFVPLPPSTGPC